MGVPGNKAKALGLIGVAEPATEKLDEARHPVGHMGQRRPGLRVEARMLDPERDLLRDLLSALRPRVRGDVFDCLFVGAGPILTRCTG